MKRLFRINMGNYGGEMTMGRVSPEFVEYMHDKCEGELIDHLHELEYEGEGENPEIPSIGDNFYAWSECDDIEHGNGVFGDSDWSWTEMAPGLEEGSMEADQDEGIHENVDFTPMHLFDRECYMETTLEMKEKREAEGYELIPTLTYFSSEKGHLGCVFIETDGEDFDPNKFVYSTVDSNLCSLVDQVWYDKKQVYVNMDWMGSTGKGDYAQVGWLVKKWHDTPESRMNDEELWVNYDEILEENNMEK